ncbi:MAG: L,D-transpeptidase family protein [Planctomycetota bacterium]
MATLRSSSRRRTRLLSRGLVGLLLLGCCAFAAYAFNPFGGDDDAVAEVPNDEQPAVEASPDVAPEPEPSPMPILRTTTPERGQPATDDWNLDAEPEPDADKAVLASAPSLSPFAEAERPAAPSGDFMADAKALVDAGKLLEARSLLNQALQSGTTDSDTTDEIKERLQLLNRVIVFTPSKRFRDDPFQGEHVVQSGDLLSKIARPHKVPYGFLARINGVRADRIRLGQSLKTIQGPLHAEVSKSNFVMDVYLGGLPGQSGSMYLTSFPVGLGADSSTPTGTWEVTRGSKLVNPEWTNPRTNEVYSRDDPENPLGERWIGLTGIAGDALGQPSYGIHGTIEPETIGTNASMGCIRLGDDDVAMVYDMLLEGLSTIRVID